MVGGGVVVVGGCVVAGAGAGAGFGLGIGIEGIGGIGGNRNRRRRLPVHPLAELEIIPMINTTIKRNANFAIFTLKENANDHLINCKALESRYVRQAKIEIMGYSPFAPLS